MDAEEALRARSAELNHLGIITDEDLEAFINRCLDALAVHLDREAVRHGLWKDYPAMDQVRQIKVKAERVMHTLERMEAGTMTPAERDLMMDEFPDLINYSIFGWRILLDEAV